MLPNILVVTSTFPRWENDTLPDFVYQLCLRLSDSYNIHILAPHTSGTRTFEKHKGIIVHRFRYAPEIIESLAYGNGIISGLKRYPWRTSLVPFFMIAQWRAIRRLHKKHNFALFHAHWLIPQGLISTFSFTRRKLPPIVCTSHGSDLFSLDNIFFRALQRTVIKRSHFVAVVSHGLKEKASKLTNDPNKLLILPMGVDITHKFIPGTRQHHKKTALFVGRLVDQKGIQQLIEAWAIVNQTHPDAILKIVGDGPKRQALKKQINKVSWKNTVIFIGALENDLLTNYYQSSTVTVFPSISAEGLGLVLVEALGCQCAVIASDLPGIRDVIINGSTGLLTPPGDIVALSKAIMKIFALPDLGTTLGINGRNHVMNKYSWEYITEKHRKIFNDIIDRQ